MTYYYDSKILDAKFADFLMTITDDDSLRQALQSRWKRNSHLVTGAILTDEAGHICLVRETNPAYAGKWNLPIGHLEHGETLQAGAKREVKEETGYDVKLLALLPPQNAPYDNTFRVIYIAKVISGSPAQRKDNDTSAVEWFTLAEIEQKLHQGELRDSAVWNDLELYRSGDRLSLDTIHEVTH